MLLRPNEPARSENLLTKAIPLNYQGFDRYEKEKIAGRYYDPIGNKSGTDWEQIA